MNFYQTAYGRHRCLFCGTRGSDNNDVALFEIDFNKDGETPSFEELVSTFGPYVIMAAEYVGTKIIICSCREHIRQMSNLRGLSDKEIAEELSRIRKTIKDTPKATTLLFREQEPWSEGG